jgi:hypothetical protein
MFFHKTDVRIYKLQANKLSFFFGASELNGMSINPFKTDSSTAKCRSDPNLSTLHALVLNSGIAFNCSLSFYLVVFMNVNSKTTDDTTYHCIYYLSIVGNVIDDLVVNVVDDVVRNSCRRRCR